MSGEEGGGRKYYIRWNLKSRKEKKRREQESSEEKRKGERREWKKREEYMQNKGGVSFIFVLVYKEKGPGVQGVHGVQGEFQEDKV